MKLRGLVPNFYIHVSVSSLYIPRVGHRYIYVGIGNEAAQFHSWNFFFEFSVQCLCSVSSKGNILKEAHFAVVPLGLYPLFLVSKLRQAVNIHTCCIERRKTKRESWKVLIAAE